MEKCEIKTWFTLVQPEDVARMWTDAELRIVLEENLNIWAGTVDGKLESSVFIMINRSEPTSP